MSVPSNNSKKKLGVILTAVMLLSMFAGPGPGLRLINPDISNPDANYLFHGIPIVYAWGLFWYVVQVAVVLTAYFTLWKSEKEEEVVKNHREKDL